MTTSLGKLRSTSLGRGKHGRGLFALSPWRAVSGGVAPYVPTGALLAGFAGVGEWNNNSSHIRTISDASLPGLNMVKFAGTATRTNAGTNKTFANFNMQNLGSVAFLTDLGDDYDKQSYDGVSLQVQLSGTGPIYTIATKTGAANDISNPNRKRTGRFWTAGKPTQQAVLDAGVGNHKFSVTSTQQTGPKTGDISLGRIYYGIGGKGAHLFRFDDAKVEAYTQFFPIMQPLGIVGELHLPIAKIGTSGCLTWAMILELAVAGWSIQINGTSDDNAMSSRSSPDDCLLDLKDQADAVVAKGLPRPIAFNYPFGSKSVNGTQINLVVSTLGNTVSVSSTAGISLGMRFLCYGVEDVTRVVAIDSANNTVTLDKPVLSTVSGIDGRFINDSGAFHGDKLYKKLLSGGWKWAWTTEAGRLFTQFGLEDYDTIQAPCNTWTQTQTLADFVAVASGGVDAKSVVAWYIHQYPGPELQAIMQYVANDVASGRSFVATSPMLEALYRRSRPPIAV